MLLGPSISRGEGDLLNWWKCRFENIINLHVHGMRRLSPSLRLAPHDSWGTNVIFDQDKFLYLNSRNKTIPYPLRKENPSDFRQLFAMLIQQLQCLHTHQGHCDIAHTLGRLFSLRKTCVSSSRRYVGWCMGQLTSKWRNVRCYS